MVILIFSAAPAEAAKVPARKSVAIISRPALRNLMAPLAFLPGSPFRTPASVLPRLSLRRVAAFGLRLLVEGTPRHVIDAPFTGIGREIALDDVFCRACPPRLR